MTGNLGHLGEIATLRPFRELRNGFLGEILPAAMLTVLSHPFFRHRHAVQAVTPTCSVHLLRLKTPRPPGEPLLVFSIAFISW